MIWETIFYNGTIHWNKTQRGMIYYCEHYMYATCTCEHTSIRSNRATTNCSSAFGETRAGTIWFCFDGEKRWSNWKRSTCAAKKLFSPAVCWLYAPPIHSHGVRTIDMALANILHMPLRFATLVPMRTAWDCWTSSVDLPRLRCVLTMRRMS